MPRPYRFLTAANSSASTTAAAVAEPPTETVAVESDFVVILAALLCALICVVGLIAVAHCAWLRRSPGDMANGRNSRQSSSANKGLKKKFVEGLPKFTYDGGDAPKLKSPECAICLADYVDGDEIRVLPQCGHGFHVGCIDTWLGSHSSCPSCRKILVIARCKKCGEFPTINSSDSGGIPTETELKSRQDCTTTTACSTTAPSSSSSSSTATYLP